jgi:uncharacterized protein (TIGR02453 family)
MRVYRDTRFSKNKLPYKTNIGIQFRHELAKDVHSPGYYVHIAPDDVFIGAGMWRPDPDSLRNIRERIAAKPAEWQRAVGDKAFRRQFAIASRTSSARVSSRCATCPPTRLWARAFSAPSNRRSAMPSR